MRLRRVCYQVDGKVPGVTRRETGGASIGETLPEILGKPQGCHPGLQQQESQPTWNHKVRDAGLPAYGCPGLNLHPRPGDGGVMVLEPQEKEEDFVYRCLDDEEGRPSWCRGPTVM
jgi:hypothetical protein